MIKRKWRYRELLASALTLALLAAMIFTLSAQLVFSTAHEDNCGRYNGYGQCVFWYAAPTPTPTPNPTPTAGYDNCLQWQGDPETGTCQVWYGDVITVNPTPTPGASE